MKPKTHRPIGEEQSAEEPTEETAGTGGLPGGGGKGEGGRRVVNRDRILRGEVKKLEREKE